MRVWFQLKGQVLCYFSKELIIVFIFSFCWYRALQGSVKKSTLDLSNYKILYREINEGIILFNLVKCMYAYLIRDVSFQNMYLHCHVKHFLVFGFSDIEFVSNKFLAKLLKQFKINHNILHPNLVLNVNLFIISPVSVVFCLAIQV